MTNVNELAANEAKLTKKEKAIWDIAKSRSGVLMLKGKPGIAKSAIIRAIAKKMGYTFVDLRLSVMDETDFGMPGKTMKVINGQEVEAMTISLPEWALRSHEKPMLINFEELNRCSQQVQNAALGVLLERNVHNFEIHPDTVMIATGNLGMDDDTSVEEFDGALNNRIIHMPYDLTIAEWEDGFATENVEPTILSFIKSKPTHFYKAPVDSNAAYATPRSWTFLSDYIKANGGDPFALIPKLREVADCYVGPSALEYITYLELTSKLTIDDVLGNYSKQKSQIEKLSRAEHTRLMGDLKEKYPMIEKLAKKKLDNLEKFVGLLDQDVQVEWIISIIDNPEFDKDCKNTIEFFRRDTMKEAVASAKKNNKS